MFNSTVQGAAGWVLPRYFDYDIVNGPANTSVEWIRIYVPGQWHPVAANTLGPAPEDSTTYREWRKVHHFEVYWPRKKHGFTTGILCNLLYLVLQGLGHQGIPTSGSSTTQHREASFRFGCTGPHVCWIDLLLGIIQFTCPSSTSWGVCSVQFDSGD